MEKKLYTDEIAEAVLLYVLWIAFSTSPLWLKTSICNKTQNPKLWKNSIIQIATKHQNHIATNIFQIVSKLKIANSKKKVQKKIRQT